MSTLLYFSLLSYLISLYCSLVLCQSSFLVLFIDLNLKLFIGGKQIQMPSMGWLLLSSLLTYSGIPTVDLMTYSMKCDFFSDFFTLLHKRKKSFLIIVSWVMLFHKDILFTDSLSQLPWFNVRFDFAIFYIQSSWIYWISDKLKSSQVIRSINLIFNLYFS